MDTFEETVFFSAMALTLKPGAFDRLMDVTAQAETLDTGGTAPPDLLYSDAARAIVF